MAKTLEEFAPVKRNSGGLPCSISVSERRQEIEDGFKAGYSAGQISRWLKEECGEAITPATLNKHRRGDCRCPRA